MHDPVLKVDGIRVSYGKKEILQGVDFDLAQGETLCLLGANGSGKSTAMNAISGFVGCTHGSIKLDGEDIHNLPAHKTFRLGMVQVSQSRDLFPQLSVEDNLRLGAEVRAKATMS